MLRLRCRDGKRSRSYPADWAEERVNSLTRADGAAEANEGEQDQAQRCAFRGDDRAPRGYERSGRRDGAAGTVE